MKTRTLAFDVIVSALFLSIVPLGLLAFNKISFDILMESIKGNAVTWKLFVAGLGLILLSFLTFSDNFKKLAVSTMEGLFVTFLSWFFVAAYFAPMSRDMTYSIAALIGVLVGAFSTVIIKIILQEIEGINLKNALSIIMKYIYNW